MSQIAPAGPPATRACSACLGRTWLLGRLAGNLEIVRGRIQELLELDDDSLIRAIAGHERDAVERELANFSADGARAAARRQDVALLCRCDAAFPARLLDLPAPPAVLHVSGSLARFERACEAASVAVVGTRAPTAYGLEAAAMLARQLAIAGLPVISGMARGIDSAAHRGALDARDSVAHDRSPAAPAADNTAPGSAKVEGDRAEAAATIAVLPAGVDPPYPRSQRRLHARLRAQAAVVSELAPGTPVRRWMFPARNRLVSALAELTVVVEAGTRSGSLVTARVAAELGRLVGAVPGRVTTPQAAGPLKLIATGALLVRDAQDVLDRLFGTGVRQMAVDVRPPPTTAQRELLNEVERGRDTVGALAGSGAGAGRSLAVLAELELAGWVRRTAGGRYTVIPR